MYLDNSSILFLYKRQRNLFYTCIRLSKPNINKLNPDDHGHVLYSLDNDNELGLLDSFLIFSSSSQLKLLFPKHYQIHDPLRFIFIHYPYGKKLRLEVLSEV